VFPRHSTQCRAPVKTPGAKAPLETEEAAGSTCCPGTLGKRQRQDDRHGIQEERAGAAAEQRVPVIWCVRRGDRSLCGGELGWIPSMGWSVVLAGDARERFAPASTFAPKTANRDSSNRAALTVLQKKNQVIIVIYRAVAVSSSILFLRTVRGCEAIAECSRQGGPGVCRPGKTRLTAVTTTKAWNLQDQEDLQYLLAWKGAHSRIFRICTCNHYACEAVACASRQNCSRARRQNCTRARHLAPDLGQKMSDNSGSQMQTSFIPLSQCCCASSWLGSLGAADEQVSTPRCAVGPAVAAAH
jgi:hypothetical protein